MTTDLTSLHDLRAALRRPPSASSDAARRVMARNRRRDSGPELEIRRALHRLGKRFRVDYPIRVDKRRPLRPDIVFTRARVAVFVDGCFWHGCPEHGTRPRSNERYWTAKIEVNRRRDREQTTRLEQAGWRVVRIWEHEPPDRAAARIVDLLDDQAAIANGGA